MKTFPELISIFKDTILCTNLNISNQLTGKAAINKRADGNTGAAVETFQSSVIAILFEVFGELGGNCCHFRSPERFWFFLICIA